MSFVGSNILAGASGQGGAGGYEIERSLRFNKGDSSYLSRQPSSAGNRKTFTLSFWIKRTKLVADFSPITASVFGAAGGSSWFDVSFYTVDELQVITNAGIGGVGCRTQAVFRDLSAWMNFVVAVDTTDSTANDRIKIYTNGVRQDVTIPSGMPAQNSDTFVNSTAAHYLGRDARTSSPRYGDNYLADVHFIDGQALAPTDFGETDDNGVWQPKKFEGTYGPLVNQSQTWSNFGTGDASSPYRWEDTFDNDSSTYGAICAINSALLLDLSSLSGGGIDYTSSVVITYRRNTSAPDVKVNGSTIGATADGVVRTHTINGSGLLTSIGSETRTAAGSGDLGIQKIEIDGKLLVDSNITVGNNSFHLPFSDNSSNAALGTDTSGNSNTWTVNNITAVNSDLAISASEVTNHNSVANYLNVFDGDITTTTSGGDNAYITWTPTTNISVSKFEAYFDNSLPNYQIVIAVSGGSTQTITITSTEGWQEFTSLSGDTIGPNNAVTFNTIRPNGTNCGLHDLNAIRINDKIVTTVNQGANIDSLVDTPTNGTQTDTGAGGEVVGNYATMNPLDLKLNQGTLTNGNLTLSASGQHYIEAKSTQEVFQYNNYSEVTVSSGTSGTTDFAFGIGDKDAWVITGGGSFVVYREDGKIRSYPGNTNLGNVPTVNVGDTIGMAVDTTNVKFYHNGTLTGTYAHGKSGTFFTILMCLPDNTNAVMDMNYGQRAFSNSNVPSGYKALCTSNLPEPTIADGSLYFDTKVWTGSSSSQSITYPFTPDFAWVKSRNQAYHHILLDTVRGDNKVLTADYPGAEHNNPSFAGGEFSGNDLVLPSKQNVNSNGNTFVGWAWDAGNSNTTIAAGSLNSSVYNQSQNWSSNYTGSFLSGYGIANAFNADFSNRAVRSTDYVVTWTGITVTTSLRVYADGTTSNEMKVILGGADVVVPVAAGAATWYDVSFTGTPTLTGIKCSSTSYSLYAIEVDGKILVDTSASPPGVPNIASTVRANPSAGFSIVTYTGTGANASVGHGLNDEPHLIFTKNRDASNYGWYTYAKAIGNDKYLVLEDTIAATSYNLWQNTTPTSSVFYLASNAAVMQNNADYVAYCFAPVEGYSAMGSYTGNGSADGPFVYTGFKPSFLLVKQSNTSNHWHIVDATRDPSNVADAWLFPDLPDVEGNNDGDRNVDFVSNGFKVRSNYSHHNTSGGTYIYLAFASNPFKTARAR